MKVELWIDKGNVILAIPGKAIAIVVKTGAYYSFNAGDFVLKEKHVNILTSGALPYMPFFNESYKIKLTRLA